MCKKMQPLPLPRIREFEKMGFGMFIHWGLYSQLGMGEWVQFLHKIEIPEYRKLMNTFTAENFDPDDIALTARETGMKYIVLTTRHHDGFSLYDTCGLNTYDAPHSAAKRDLIAEFVNACRKYDIIPFFYHTTLDWQWHGKRTQDLTDEDFQQYLDYLCKSIEILCKNYGEIGGFWFDGNWSRPDSDWQEDRLYRTIRKYQPECIIINNTGLFQLGKLGHEEIDSVTFENNHAKALDRTGHKKYVAAEVCKTMNSNWGIGNSDLNFMSPAEVIKRFASARGCGANFLLNIGPTAQGSIPDYERCVLKLVGKWHANFNEALHIPRPATECKCQGEDFILQDGNRYYYFVFNLGVIGDENVTLESMIGARSINVFFHSVKSVKWLDSGEKLSFLQNVEEGILMVNCTGYCYGTDMVVRIALIETY